MIAYSPSLAEELEDGTELISNRRTIVFEGSTLLQAERAAWEYINAQQSRIEELREIELPYGEEFKDGYDAWWLHE